MVVVKIWSTLSTTPMVSQMREGTMLEFALPGIEPRVIPNTFGRWWMAPDGSMLPRYGDQKPEIETINGVPYCRTGIDWLPEFTTVAKMVLLAWKPVNIPIDKIAEIEVLFRDENPLNVHPSNLIWRFPEPISVPGAEEFAFIPAFTNYAINESGDILSCHTGDLCSQYVTNTGYWSLRMTSDVGKSVEFHRHRSMAYTYVPYGYDVCELIANHIDLNKLNCHPTNLEWTTHDGNMKHASWMMGSGKWGSKSVDLKDITTEQIWSFDSIRKCAEFIGLTDKHVAYALRHGRYGSILSNKYIVKETNQPWPDISKRTDLHRISGRPAPVITKNVLTGEIVQFSSAAKFVEHSGLTRKQVYPYLKDGVQRRQGNWLFKYVDNLDDWIL